MKTDYMPEAVFTVDGQYARSLGLLGEPFEGEPSPRGSARVLPDADAQGGGR